MCVNDCRSGALGYLRAINFKMVSSGDFAGRCEFALPVLQGKPQLWKCVCS